MIVVWINDGWVDGWMNDDWMGGMEPWSLFLFLVHEVPPRGGC